jgi:hypothetical protein
VGSCSPIVCPRSPPALKKRAAPPARLDEPRPWPRTHDDCLANGADRRVRASSCACFSERILSRPLAGGCGDGMFIFPPRPRVGAPLARVPVPFFTPSEMALNLNETAVLPLPAPESQLWLPSFQAASSFWPTTSASSCTTTCVLVVSLQTVCPYPCIPYPVLPTKFSRSTTESGLLGYININIKGFYGLLLPTCFQRIMYEYSRFHLKCSYKSASQSMILLIIGCVSAARARFHLCC